jgi:hypothetical protein
MSSRGNILRLNFCMQMDLESWEWVDLYQKLSPICRAWHLARYAEFERDLRYSVRAGRL